MFALAGIFRVKSNMHFSERIIVLHNYVFSTMIPSEARRLMLDFVDIKLLQKELIMSFEKTCTEVFAAEGISA